MRFYGEYPPPGHFLKKGIGNRCKDRRDTGEGYNRVVLGGVSSSEMDGFSQRFQEIKCFFQN